MQHDQGKTISEGTNKAYAAIDVAMFDPLMSNEVSLERIVYAFSGLRMPNFFFEIYGSHNMRWSNSLNSSESPDLAKARDAAHPSRVFRNFFQENWRKEYEKLSHEIEDPKRRAENKAEVETSATTLAGLKLPKPEEKTPKIIGMRIKKIEDMALNAAFSEFEINLEEALISKWSAESRENTRKRALEICDRVSGGPRGSLKFNSIKGDIQRNNWEPSTIFDPSFNTKESTKLQSRLKHDFTIEFAEIITSSQVEKDELDGLLALAVVYHLDKLVGYNYQGVALSDAQKFIVATRFRQYRCVTPLGIMNRYRQHFFYGPLLRGKCNEIRSVAPFEALEIITTNSRSDTVEETVVNELEVTLYNETATKDSIDLTERVANTVARSATTNISANGSYSALIWNASGNVSQSVTDSTSSSTERISQKLNEITTKQSETIRKKTATTTKVSTTRTESVTSRHAFENKTDNPMVVGLYSVGHKIETQIQANGLQLVWQTRIDRPGDTLARSQFLDQVVVPAQLGFVRTNIRGEVTTSLRSTLSNVYLADAIEAAFESAIPKDPALRATPHFFAAKKVISGFIANGKNNPPVLCPPSTFEVSGEKVVPTTATTLTNPEMNLVSVSLSCPHPGGAHGYTFDESDDVKIANGQPISGSKLEIVNGLLKDVLIKHVVEHNNTFTIRFILVCDIPVVFTRGDNFNAADPTSEQARRLNEINSLKSELNHDYRRSRADLLLEERKTILANKISTLVRGIPGYTESSDAMQQLYLRIGALFDLDQLFYDVNTFEYQEAFRIAQQSRLGRALYNIHSEMESGNRIPDGSSLGWEHQIDGDFQRNVFLNAPFAWACLPVKAGKEADAVEFLTEYGILVGKPERFTKTVNQEFAALREFQKLFPQAPSARESDGRQHIEPNALVEEFWAWWKDPGHHNSDDDNDNDNGNGNGNESTDSIGYSFLDCLFGKHGSKKQPKTKIMYNSYSDEDWEKNLANAVRVYVKRKTVTAADVYPIVSISDTFVPIDGMAIEKISLR